MGLCVSVSRAPFVCVTFELGTDFDAGESQEEPRVEEVWTAFTDRLPREIRLRQYRAGKRSPPRLELAELADALGQALAYCPHLQTGYEEEKAINAASTRPRFSSASPSAVFQMAATFYRSSCSVSNVVCSGYPPGNDL